MPRSEIDDIFATKGKHASLKDSSSSVTTQKPDTSAKKSSKKKRKREVAKEEKAVDDKEDQERPAKRKIPETVVDPSIEISAPKKQERSARPSKLEAVKSKKKDNKGEEEKFKDSRGTGPRRKTDEGFAIYKEDELGITEQGGDTPLCPFDCECCKCF
ncbi:DUF1764-domain-containing protein [Trametopsis cervina]|nr:DUF1764-domain-containing protein [Trametopsis cervina]